MSVRTYQHRKAIGNARGVVRSAMIPVLRDVLGQDAEGQIVTDYGPEKTSVPLTTITVDLAGTANVIAVGRLERLSNKDAETWVRSGREEAYSLYWLPFSWDYAEGDYYSNPIKVGATINPEWPDLDPCEFLAVGSRIWLVLDSNSLVPAEGDLAHEFTVVESFRNGIADLVEFEAKVVKSEGSLPRSVVYA